MAGVGEMLVSAVVKEVVGKLGSGLWDEIGRIWGLKDDMNKMKSDLEMVAAVLDDAEKKSITDKPTCLWLKELKFAAYDIEDMMCGFETKIPPKHGLGGSLMRALSSVKMGVKKVKLANQMKDMKKRLTDITEKRSRFGLSMNSGTRFDKERVIKDRATVSDISEKTSILGRERERRELLELLKSDSEDVSVIAIVGLGGIGKSTLAQLLYNDGQVKEIFDQQGWAYVSMEFDKKNIGRALLESFGGCSQILDSLQGVCKILKEKISGKRYCIVLDDVWEEDGNKLEELRRMLHGGKKGSKIIITTRSEKVATQMRASHSYKLKVLSDDHCWHLFSQRAFTSESEKSDGELVGIGKEIVQKCGGIPLAAKALGYIMRSKKSVDEWLAVKDSEIWKLDDPNILPSMKLGYFFMPSYLKLCFGYCSIFPKGSGILKDELIQQWIALGFIQPIIQDLSLEKCGEIYINNLLDMSFLELDKTKTELGMHDLVHDLARSIFKDELLVLDAKKGATHHDGDNDYRYVLLLNFKVLSEVCGKLPNKIRAIHFQNLSEKMDFPDHAFSSAKYIRLLHLNGSSSPEFLISIQNLKRLRYLCVPFIEHEIMPECFGKLLNLRYLDMSNGRFKNLPASSKNLSLEILKLNGCLELEVLPETLNQVRLQELYLSDCKNLKKFLKYNGNRTCLAKLDMKNYPYPPFLDNMHGFVLAKRNSSPYYDLLEVSKVTAETTIQNLEIMFLENVRNPEDALKASLCTKSRLKSINLKWSYPKTRSLEDASLDEAILENLVPPKSLNKLIIDGCSAPILTCNWLFNNEFLPNLSLLYLENLKNCEHLPSLGTLPNLSMLSIINMPSLKNLDEAFIGGQGACKRLKVLVLVSLLELVEWPTKCSNGSDMQFVFTELEVLEVYKCPKLKFKPSFPGCQRVTIERSPNALSSRECERSTSVKDLGIVSCELESGTLPDIIKEMTNLDTIDIIGCDSLTVIPEWVKKFWRLRLLTIMGCNSLVYFPDIHEYYEYCLISIYSRNKLLVEWSSRVGGLRIDPLINTDYYLIQSNKNMFRPMRDFKFVRMLFEEKKFRALIIPEEYSEEEYEDASMKNLKERLRACYMCEE